MKGNFGVEVVQRVNIKVIQAVSCVRIVTLGNIQVLDQGRARIVTLVNIQLQVR